MRPLKTLRYWAARTLSRLGLLPLLRRLGLAGRPAPFTGSDAYWKARYESGGDSGEGSYGPLADYKADFVNRFCGRHGIASALELGCGDGNQTAKFAMGRYTGVDISETCIAWARANIRKPGFAFLTAEEFQAARLQAELGLSLDVVYHLVEDQTYETYLDRLFESATRFVLIYSSDMDYFNPAFPHVRHRPVVADCQARFEDWVHRGTERNPFHRHPDDAKYGSFADFHIFEKQG